MKDIKLVELRTMTYFDLVPCQCSCRGMQP